MTLDQAPVGSTATIVSIAGERSFRRRLLELGLLPGVRLEVVRVAPLGDPLELRARGASLSIRRREAGCITIEPLAAESTAAAHRGSLPQAASPVRPSS